MSRSDDEKWMRRCFALAAKGIGRVSPNPLVGAVIVRNGILLGQGYHQKVGGAHAEVNALNDARRRHSDVRGATLYVNLEPCAHYGKTPPCADAIVRAGIGKVVAAMKDPNPLVAGKGFVILRMAGIKLRIGILKNDAHILNEKFMKYITTGLPFVALKAAQTKDGFIAREDGSSRWISSKASRRFVHQLRAEYDAVVVGARTAAVDDPKLTVRTVNGRNPLRVLIDGNLSAPVDAAIFSDKDRQRTIVFFGRGKKEKVKILKAKGVQLVPMKSRNGRIEVRDVLSKAAERGIASLLVEGGQSIYRQFLAARKADKIYLFTSPQKFHQGLLTFGRTVPRFKIRRKQIRTIGGDVLTEGYLSY